MAAGHRGDRPYEMRNRCERGDNSLRFCAEMTFIRSDFVLAVDGAGEIADADREFALSRYFMGLEASRWKRGLREPDLLDALLLHVSVEADVGRLRSF